MSRKQKIAFGIVGMLIAGFLLLQIIPVGDFREVLERKPNPPVHTTINWTSEDVKRIVQISCYDCHSNETVYPWYSHVAPFSWLVTRDVNKGREAMNFSEDAPTDYNLTDMEWHLFNDMPPGIYALMHPQANLTDEQKDLLLAEFKATFTEASHEGMDMGN